VIVCVCVCVCILLLSGLEENWNNSFLSKQNPFPEFHYEDHVYLLHLRYIFTWFIITHITLLLILDSFYSYITVLYINYEIQILWSVLFVKYLKHS
jgi:hypothetical protein